MKLILPWCRMMATLLIACSLIILAGCKTRIVVIPSDKIVSPMQAGQAYTPTNSGWFVPDARMQEILTELNRKQ